MKRKNSSSLSEYFGIENAIVENGCVIRLPEGCSRKIQDALEMYLFLKDEYIYLQGSNILIDRLAVNKIKKKTVLGSITQDEMNVLIAEGIFNNENVYVDMKITDTLQNPELSDFPLFKKKIGEYYDRINGIETVFIGTRGIETDFKQNDWSMQDVVDYFSKSFLVYHQDIDPRYWNEFTSKIRKDKDIASKKVFLSDARGEGGLLYHLPGRLCGDIDKSYNECVGKEYCLLYEGDRPTREEIEKYISFMIKNPNTKYHLQVKGIGDIPKDLMGKIVDSGIDLKVSINPQDKTFYQETEVEYDIAELNIIRENLDTLLSGIDKNLPEIDRFKEIYKRVCLALTYDDQAGYPQTPEEERYAEENEIRSRNLSNGLIFGRCVCSGYADILRNALDMYGLESEYVLGLCVEEPISREEYDKQKDSFVTKGKVIFDEFGDKVTLASTHAWVKVKIDGKWYNCDPTADQYYLDEVKTPEFCLLSDSEISRKNVRREKITGHECIDEYPKDKIHELFTQDKSAIEKLKSILHRFWDKISSNSYTLPRLDAGGAFPAPASKPNVKEKPSWDLSNYPKINAREQGNIRKKNDVKDIER